MKILNRPIIKGLCVAALLAALGLGFADKEWWVAMVALNVAFNV